MSMAVVLSDRMRMIGAMCCASAPDWTLDCTYSAASAECAAAVTSGTESSVAQRNRLMFAPFCSDQRRDPPRAKSRGRLSSSRVLVARTYREFRATATQPRVQFGFMSGVSESLGLLTGSSSDLRATLTMELCENAVHVVLYGREADAAGIRDLLVGVPTRDQAADFPLSPRQRQIGSRSGRLAQIRRQPRRRSLDGPQSDVNLLDRRSCADEHRAAALQLTTTAARRPDEQDSAINSMSGQRLRQRMRRRVDDQDVGLHFLGEREGCVEIPNGARDHDVAVLA